MLWRETTLCSSVLLAAFSALVVGACEDSVPADEVGVLEAPYSRGTWLNGTWLNGTWLNGTSLKGTWLNGTTLDGTEVRDLALDGSMLVGWWRGSLRSGADLVGLEMNGFDEAGGIARLRVEAVDAPTALDDDVWSYVVAFRDGLDWRPICGTAADGTAIGAIAVNGRWDERSGVLGGGDKIDEPGVITLACRGIGAIAKCVDGGYRPWATAGGVSLDAHHQACVRMIRNDLCGDGVSYTTNGRPINVYDGVGIQSRDGGGLLATLDTTLTWVFEAEWTAGGARCLSTDLRDRFIAAGVIPPCLGALTKLFCGASSHFSSGTKIMSDVRSTDLYLLGIQL